LDNRDSELADAGVAFHLRVEGRRQPNTDIPIMQIDSDPTTIEPIGDLCRRTIELDDSCAIVLGCAAPARFATPLTERLGVPVTDGIRAATVLGEALVTLTSARISPPE
jgi:Asp/Glu/hydantoin racemase